MNAFRFANPHWIHLLWGVLVLAGLLVFLEVRGRSVLERFVSRSMQPRLVRRASLARRLAALSFVLLAMVLLVCALMRPQWGLSVQRVARVDSQIMICLDASKSMLAEDVAPNRLERAKIELDSLLGLMSEGQQVGLIAFAGKATVLCPMTTDFGFLRMILNEAEPSSVGLGGTQIGDAIRKAVDGFRESGDINRLILLVTDGEDHDSFPLEAAKAAKEKGVKIVSIGFGDEAGSKIEVLDPRTGARTFVKDRNGEEVVSRLDGETLRDIALQTDGAYIPAGTGALDLESIYRTYIATLLQGSVDSQTQVVRYEAYQWLVLTAVVLWLIGLALSVPWYLRLDTGMAVPAAPAARAAAWVAGLTLVASASVLSAQDPPAKAAVPPRTQDAAPTAPAERAPRPAAAATATTDKGQAAPAAEPVDADSAAEEVLAPRAAYNQAVACLASDLPQAEKYLNRARRDAGSDGELRYRALYNLGWVEIRHADGRLKENPQQALQHLQQAANRFREAVRVRPNSTEARHNLELVSQRILELTDALAQKDPRDLSSRLDELIQQLRSHQTELQGIVQQSGAEVAHALAATYRQEFRRLGVTQREVIAELQLFADDVRKELDAVNQKPKDQQSPQDQLQVGQYTNMLQFLDSSLQRLSQSRSLTRRLQGDRAFRRWSAGLADVKRARDQLRNPVELLSQIVSDATETLELTGTLAAATDQLEPTPATAPPPSWLTREYLQELQASTLERTKELAQVLAAAAPAQETHGPQASSALASPTDQDSADQDSAATQDPRTKQLLENIPRALPSIQTAVTAFEESSGQLATGSLEQAQVKQSEAIAALLEAAEWFFDVRRMIEAMYAAEQYVARGVQGAQPDLDRLREAFALQAQRELTPQDIPRLLREIAATIAPIQKKNRERSTRLDKMLDQEIAQPQTTPPAPAPTTPAAAPGAAAAPDEAKQQQAQLERLQLAKQLLTQATSDVDKSLPLFEALAAEPPPMAAPAGDTPATDAAAPASPLTPSPAQTPPRDPKWNDAEVAVTSALKSLEDLRRLFFSLVEHLRDTAQRQADLNDDTTQQSTEPAAAQTAERLGPLGSRQAQLQPITKSIAQALREQSTQATTASAASLPAASAAGTTDPAQAAQAAKTLAEAATLVEAAHTAMSEAAQRLTNQTSPFDPAGQPFKDISQQQQRALEKLAEALALLDKSQQPPDQQNKQDQNEQQNSENQQSEDQKQQQNMSASQLLQLIMDREAQRREDKKQRNRMPSTTVDKDW